MNLWISLRSKTVFGFDSAQKILYELKNVSLFFFLSISSKLHVLQNIQALRHWIQGLPWIFQNRIKNKSYGLSFCRSKLFWSNPNHIFSCSNWTFLTHFHNFYLLTCSKWLVKNQNDLGGPKSFWTRLNHFGHIEGQGIT